MQRIFQSFDGQETATGTLLRPDRYRHLFAELDAGNPIIPRGAGLTYCGASAGSGVRSVSNERFNRILDFDAAVGEVVVETGIQLGELYRFTAPRGRQLAILPGHPSITVGGCIGCNVHGKNHVRDGTFINVVKSLKLYHPDHGEIECSRTVNRDVFDLTVGGFGLTGFVTSARLALAPITAARIRIRKTPVAGPVEAAAAMESLAESDLCYSWHNFNRRGTSFGKGFVYSGNAEPDSGSSGESDDASSAATMRYRDLTSDWRGRWRLGALSAPAIRAAMAVYGFLEGLGKSDRILDAATAAFPINGKEIYFRLFGRRGFREYQVLFPRAAWSEAVEVVSDLLRRHRLPIGLASLKLFRGSTSYLRFDGDGVCLAMDTPASAESEKFFADLDAAALRLGGIANISKDSRLGAEVVRRMYPDYERFKTELNRFDPRRRFDSALRRRLDV